MDDVIQVNQTDIPDSDQFNPDNDRPRKFHQKMNLLSAFWLDSPVFAARNGHQTPPSRRKVFRLSCQDILDNPMLYVQSELEIRNDPLVIVAVVAQCDSSILMSFIPVEQLNPAFVSALCDHFPKNEAFKERAADFLSSTKMVSYAAFKNAIITMLITIALVALTVHFWPIIALWPANQLILLLVGQLSVVGLLVCPVFVYQYMTHSYPESKKITDILQRNNCFKQSDIAGGGFECSDDMRIALSV